MRSLYGATFCWKNTFPVITHRRVCEMRNFLLHCRRTESSGGAEAAAAEFLEKRMGRIVGRFIQPSTAVIPHSSEPYLDCLPSNTDARVGGAPLSAAAAAAGLVSLNWTPR